MSLARAAARIVSAGIASARIVAVWCTAVWLALGGASARAAEPPPLVVAVDTSRSLDRAALGRVVDELRQMLDELPPSTQVALLSFDDDPRWLVELGDAEATPAGVSARLDDLRLGGGFTLLHDALFTAVRSLDGSASGGVVLLASDGRDENSAVTVDDIARRAGARGVRILTLGTGRTIDRLSLRRLALVTDGEYLGDVPSADDASLAEAVLAQTALAQTAPASGDPLESVPRSGGTRAPSALGDAEGPEGAESSDELRAAAPGVGGRAAEQRGADASAEGAAGDAGGADDADADRVPLWVLLAAFLALAAAAWLVWRTRSAAGAEPDDDEAELERRAEDEAVAHSVRQELLAAEVASSTEKSETSVDTQKIQKLSLEDRLEQTRVLASHAMLVVRRPGAAPRSFLLDESKAFAVGRDHRDNTLALPDPALSARHFKIVPRLGEYYFVDLESTNGSFIDGRRTVAKRLRAGDRIHAGQVEFEFQSYGDLL